MISMRTKIGILVILFVLFAINSVVAQPTADWLGIEEDFTIIKNSSTVVSIDISNTQNEPIAAIILSIEFNKSVVNISNIERGELVMNWDPPYLKHFDWGVRVVTVFSGNEGDAIPVGSTGSVLNLNFSAVGNFSESSYVNIISNSVASSGAMKIGYIPTRNVSVTILEEWIYGDVNGDRCVDLLDLIRMKRAVVWEIEPTRHYDLNKNGICGDIGDLVLMKKEVIA
jgi:hypothetical protein